MTKSKAKLPRPAKGPKPALGWREWVALPNLGLEAVKAKVDTGARSSSLHAEDIELFERGGQTFVRFHLGGLGRPKKSSGHLLEVPILEQRWITSSNGKRQKRPIIRTEISLLGSRWAIDLSLSPRATMGFPMLLGREAIRGRFVVEPGRSFLAKEHAPKAVPGKVAGQDEANSSAAVRQEPNSGPADSKASGNDLAQSPASERERS